MPHVIVAEKSDYNWRPVIEPSFLIVYDKRTG